MVTSFMGMSPVVFWLVLAIILAVFEILTQGLSTIWFAFGAFFAFLCAIGGMNVPLQIVVFILVSVVSLVLVRPWSLKYLNSRIEKTNIDALIGKKVQVTKDIDNSKEQGAVSLEGTVWNARSLSGDEVIHKGDFVLIQRIEGNKLFVIKES